MSMHLPDYMMYRVQSDAWDQSGIRKKPPALPHGPIGWLKTVLTTPDEFIVEMNGLDAYLFVRL